jgi:hypothetical protein
MKGPDRATRVARAKMAAAAGELRCDFEDECHPSVALVSVVTPDGLARCTGSLISEDEVLTNDHCVKNSLSASREPTRLSEIPCEGEVYVHFARSGEIEPVSAGCRSIRIRSAENGIGSADFAVLKLARKIPARSPLAPSPGGFQNGQIGNVFRVQMDGGEGYSGTQSLLRCDASHSTFLYPQVTDPEGALMTFGDCAIQLGNSGSPVLNAQGELVALVQGYLMLRENPVLQKELEPLLLDRTYGLTAISTQVHCLGSVWNRSVSACRDVPDLTSLTLQEYLDGHAPWSAEVLPPPAEKAWKWAEMKSEDPLRKRFRSHPACAESESFEAEERRFRKGLDSKMQAAWRPEAEVPEKILFGRKGGVENERILYSHPVRGSIRLPVCTAAPLALAH